MKLLGKKRKLKKQDGEKNCEGTDKEASINDGQINKITVVDLDEIPTPKRHVLNLNNQQPNGRVTPVRQSNLDESRLQLSENLLRIPNFDVASSN